VERTTNLANLGEITRDSLRDGVQRLTYVTRAEIQTIQPAADTSDEVRFVVVP